MCAEEAVPQEHGKAGSGAATCTLGWQRGKDTVPPAFENAALGRIVDSVLALTPVESFPHQL